MDRAEFIEKAPLYYALAIAFRFADGHGAQTRQGIMNAYTVGEDGSFPDDAVCLVEDIYIWERAVAWLAAREMIVAFSDPFGPPIYTQTKTFGETWFELCASQSPFQNARASGDAEKWLIQALHGVLREYSKLDIKPSDFDKPEQEWEPIPLDHSSEALQNVIGSLDKTITEVEQSNGYASWPAPGSEDTELGVFMGPEVSHGATKVYTRVQA